MQETSSTSKNSFSAIDKSPPRKLEKARFSEAILAIGGHRSAIIKATSTGRISAIADFDAWTLGIPATTVATASDHVVDGAITITWRSDGTSLAGETYTLAAQGFALPLQWVASGSCVASGYCKILDQVCCYSIQPKLPELSQSELAFYPVLGNNLTYDLRLL